MESRVRARERQIAIAGARLNARKVAAPCHVDRLLYNSRRGEQLICDPGRNQRAIKSARYGTGIDRALVSPAIVALQYRSAYK